MKKYLSRFLESESGFSLVELAIVLAVIGLIIGGVLKGQELLESARQKAVLSQVEEIRAAVHTFQDRYQSLPGNYANATDHINPSLKNGNGNGEISGPGLSLDSEAGQFFLHLGAADLIPPSGTPSGTQGSFGKGLPSSKLGGGFTVMLSPKETMPGHWLVLGKEHGQEGNGGLLTPKQARSLMMKGGSTNPSLGPIRVMEGADKSSGTCLKNETDFNMESNEKACVLYFQL